MSKILRFAVVGIGGMGKAHLRGIFNNEFATLAAICDTNEEFAKQCAADNNLEKYYLDFDEMLANEEIDVVIVCTPDQVHMDYTVKSLKAGKHVLCEKPMAQELSECKAMVAAAKETGMKLMIGQVCRKAPGFVKAKELVDAGVIGDLFMVESEYAHDYARIPGRGGWQWRTDPVQLRHPVIGGGCHAIDLLRWIAGNPSEVFAYANRKMLTDWPVDDCTMAIMKFPNDVIGKVMTSVGCKRKYTMRTCLYGSKGTIICDNTSPDIELQLEVVDENNKASYDIQKIPVDINNHNVTSEIEELIDCILNDKPVPTDGIEGASTVAVGYAIVQSAATGDKVVVDYNF
ncbi:MAG: Gfo/Idh/MocA family oxidoreductase [Clostridia bacterium]|nr:Gfo/Idh/MocA family oxidoreductase [Clostridia bacterium]